MNDETLRALGKLVPEGMQRDAVHIAVVPVVAGMGLSPGEHVFIDPNDGEALSAAIEDAQPAVGVVDPYLREEVKNHERFWLFLNPGSITSLRHEWTHPAFPVMGKTETDKANARAMAEVWLGRLAKSENTDIETLLKACGALEGSYYLSESPASSLSDKFQNGGDELCELFWQHVETYLGRPVKDNVKGWTSFRCAC